MRQKSPRLTSAVLMYVSKNKKLPVNVKKTASVTVPTARGVLSARGAKSASSLLPFKRDLFNRYKGWWQWVRKPVIATTGLLLSARAYGSYATTQDRLNEDMFNAYAEKNIEKRMAKLTMALKQGADVNAKMRNKLTLLEYESLKNDPDIALVKILFEHGAQVNTESKAFMSTPLNNALARYNGSGANKELVELLVERGADVNKKDITGYTPLHHAVARQNVEAVDFLITHGADPAMTDGWGLTPLDHAQETLDSISSSTNLLSKIFKDESKEVLQERAKEIVKMLDKKEDDLEKEDSAVFSQEIKETG